MGRATRVATESTWIQLNGPNRGCREVIQNELAARRTMREAQIHPVARCAVVPFRKANWADPSTKAEKAAATWT